jgi:HSP20 family protein
MRVSTPRPAGRRHTVADKSFEERWGRFRDLVEHLFLEPGRGSVEADVVWYPATDAYETESDFVVRMDLSGVKREEISIALRDRVLCVQGIRSDTTPRIRKTFHKMEVSMGPFARSIQVPTRFARSEAQATYADGILEIRLQARGEKEPHEIDIEADER